MLRSLLPFAVAGLLAAPAAVAQPCDRVTDKAAFISLIRDKALTRVGITLRVDPGGAIEGRAFGQTVKGAWQWKSGLFCRDLSFGKRDLGPNCQVVQRNGDTVRFIADEGKGDYADLRLK